MPMLRNLSIPFFLDNNQSILLFLYIIKGIEDFAVIFF